MVDDYSRFIGLPKRKPKPAIGVWGSESDLLPGDPGFTPQPQSAQDFDAWMADARARGMFDEPAAMARTEVAADGTETSPLMAQLMAIRGPGEVMTPESVQAAKQAYAARGGEFARGRLPTVEAARERQEAGERAVQGAADTSKATSSDGPPDTEPLYRQAFLDQLANVGRAARGEATQRVASPELAARDELAKWLASKQAREAEAGKLAQQERLEQMRALLGLAKEEAATGREKMQQEGATKRAEIEAGAKRDIQAAKEKALADARAAGLPTIQAKNEAKKAADEAKRAADEAEAQRKATEGLPYGYRLKPGANPSKGQREDAAKAIEQRDSVKPAIEQLERLTSQGAQRLVSPSARAEVRQVAQQIGAAVRSMENLGVPSGPDMKIQLDLIGDPTSSVNEVANVLPQLMGNLKDYFDRKARVRLETLGIEKDAGAGAPAGAARDTRPIAKNAKTGERRYVNPDGSLGEVVP